VISVSERILVAYSATN